MTVAVLVACLLLLAGTLVRQCTPWLRGLAIPASVIGGVLGLVLLQVGMATAGDAPTRLSEFADGVSSAFRPWPGTLIAVIFAGLLLERRGSRLGVASRGALRQGAMVWIIVVGEVVVGVGATWLLIGPSIGVPATFGQLIETGFAGGHGTAAAMGDVWTMLGHPDFVDLAMFMATAGLLYSVISGIVIVNLAVAFGWVTRRAGVGPASGSEGTGERVVVSGTAIDPLALQIGLVGAAFALGAVFQWLFVLLASEVVDEETMRFLDKIPLFLFTLIGGLTLRWILTTAGLEHVIDGARIRRLMGTAMDFLIVAALASIRIETVLSYAWPLALLLVLGFAWTGFCLLVLARRILPRDSWFELGILNYGMSTGTTAQGMMLLRMVDPDLESDAAEEYALAAPLSAPFIGGGVLTLGLPRLMELAGVGTVLAILAAVIIGLYALARSPLLRRAE